MKNDVDVTAADIAAHNLVLFGDPSSNAIYRKIADRLPIRWRADGVVVGQEKFSANHAPVFVFPNPLNPARYVVINSGFTFHDQANNAMQSPKLPDWAVVDITRPGNNYRYLPLFVTSQGFFDEGGASRGRRSLRTPNDHAPRGVPRGGERRRGLVAGWQWRRHNLSRCTVTRPHACRWRACTRSRHTGRTHNASLESSKTRSTKSTASIG